MIVASLAFLACQSIHFTLSRENTRITEMILLQAQTGNVNDQALHKPATAWSAGTKLLTGPFSWHPAVPGPQ